MEVKKHYTGSLSIKELREMITKHLKEQGFVNPTITFNIGPDPDEEGFATYHPRVLLGLDFHADDKKEK